MRESKYTEMLLLRFFMWVLLEGEKRFQVPGPPPRATALQAGSRDRAIVTR